MSSCSPQGLAPDAVLVDAHAHNGCARVSTIMRNGRPSRLAYKYLFALPRAQWSGVALALVHVDALRLGHVHCESSMYFQDAVTSSDTLAPLTPEDNPEWLDAEVAASSVCYTDVFLPIHPPGGTA